MKHFRPKLPISASKSSVKGGNMSSAKEKVFTGYQVFVIAILAFLQFSVVLDFMVLSPLGVILMKELAITPSKFSLAVSAYAFSAGASGLLAAGFADKFDRKKLLMFFYGGFLLGTTLCAIAPTFEFLIMECMSRKCDG